MSKPGRGNEADEALLREALRQWLDWYLAFHGDAAAPHAGEDDGTGSGYDAALRALKRASQEHADPTLNRLLAQERRHFDWPASIHAIILDMPREWRLCLLGAALEHSQAWIGRQIGLRQQLVSVMLKQAKQSLLLRLKVLARTRRAMAQLGVRVEEGRGGLRGVPGESLIRQKGGGE